MNRIRIYRLRQDLLPRRESGVRGWDDIHRISYSSPCKPISPCVWLWNQSLSVCLSVCLHVCMSLYAFLLRCQYILGCLKMHSHIYIFTHTLSLSLSIALYLLTGYKMEPTKPLKKNAIRNCIPPLVTKNSSDLLPLNIRAGLTKDSVSDRLLLFFCIEPLGEFL